MGIIMGLDVVQQPPPLTNELEQTPPGGMVFFIGFEVSGEVVDPFREDGHLDIRGTGIGVVGLVLNNQCLFALLGNGHEFKGINRLQ